MAATEIKVQMQQRRDTAAGWTSAGTVLLAGELGYETDTGYAKLGDGSTAWGSLAYLPAAGKALDGTEALPGISFRDDASLGLYRPAADELGISTSGTERIRVASDGDIGIRTKTPAFGLHLAANSQADAVLFIEAGTSAGDDAQIIFGEADETGNRGKISYPAGNHYMAFETNGNEQVRLDSTGRLNIGASSNAYTSALLQTNTSNGSFFVTRYSHLLLQNKNASTANWWNIAPRDNGNLTIGNGAPDANGIVSDQKIVINSSGNVGIGTASADRPFHVEADGTDGTQVQIQGTSDSAGLKLVPSSGDHLEIQATTASDLVFYNRTDTTDLMRVNSSGNVGIGTSSPEDPLHIKSNSGAIRLENSVVSNNDSIISYDNDTLLFQCDANNVRGSSAILFKSDDQDRLKIDDSGRVGIATSSPDFHLDVNGNIGLTEGQVLAWHDGSGNKAGDIYMDSSDNIVFRNTSSVSESARISSTGNFGLGTSTPTVGNAGARLFHIHNTASTGTRPSEIVFTNGSTGQTSGSGGTVTYYQDDLYMWNYESQDLIFGTNATERMRVDNSGNLYIGGSTAATADIALNANGTVKCAGTDIAIDDTGIYLMNDGNAASGNYRARVKTDGSADFTGAVSKGSGSFKIDHPLKPETHQLVHSFVEGPQADNLYRGKVDLAAGTATVNIDTVAGMTEGTFVVLNREVQCFTTNETGWTAIKGSVAGNLLTITAQDNTCTDTISWLVIGERQDQHMYDTGWTNENGKVIVEPEKPVVAS
jgi:hypothetical protein